MELRILNYFLTVVQEGNISKAAEILHITQPTLSRQISQLEEELGVKLFERGKNLILTDAGVLLRHRAEEVIGLMEKIENDFDDQKEVSGIISIGSGGLNAFQSLPEIMHKFREKYPKVQFKLYSNSANYIKELLDRGLLDFGFLLEPSDVSKYDYIRMKDSERWGVFMRYDHKLVQKDNIQKEDLEHIPIMISDRIPLQKEIANWFGGGIDHLNIFSTYNTIINVTSFIDDNVACALTIEGAVNYYDKDRFVFRPLFPELTMSSVLSWKKFQPTSNAAAKFLEYFKSMS